ncbi:FecR domain-containing protein [bacterium]|nr:FecR domain-containing protein [bacterium]
MKPVMRTGLPLVWLCLFGTAMLFGQAGGDVEVIFTGGESLRDLAERYLQEPNDWELILLYNRKPTVDDLQPGDSLLIPVGKYHDLSRYLAAAREAIVKANGDGAGVLSPALSANAVQSLDEALQLKKRGDLDGALERARHALEAARQAGEETWKKRIEAITAVLSEKRGTVQYRSPDYVRWTEALKNQELKEEEQLRTLSQSFGTIRFVDGSVIQMDENALIVIEAVRKDVITNAHSADVLVVEGDVSVFIKNLSDKSDISVKNPGVETDIRSRNFLTSRDRQETIRISNFDGEIDVISRGKTVTLEQNQGTKVLKDTPPADPSLLPDAPDPVSPRDEETLGSRRVLFSWTPEAPAAAYSVQIARNAECTDVIARIEAGTEAKAVWDAETNGNYYWRIRAVDRDRMSGPWSKPYRFSVQVDRTPPFLALFSPAADTLVYSDSIIVRGIAERDAVLTAGTDTLILRADGSFHCRLPLRVGEQTLTVTAVDGSGNRSEIHRTVVRGLAGTVLECDQGEVIVTNTRHVALTGRCEPDVTISIDGTPVFNQNGAYMYYGDFEEGRHEVALRAVTPDRRVQVKTVDITVDTTPPALLLDGYPQYTDQASVTLTGTVSEPVDLDADGVVLALEGDRFSYTAELVPGENRLSLRAIDRAGNRIDRLITVCRDNDPPEIQSVSFSAEHVEPGDVVELTVTASDRGAGLARTGTFTAVIQPGNVEVSGLLKLTDSKDRYTGRVQIPPQARGRIRAARLYISDYLGNLNEK